MSNIWMSKLSRQVLETKICITDSWIHVNEYAYKLKKTQISNQLLHKHLLSLEEFKQRFL